MEWTQALESYTTKLTRRKWEIREIKKQVNIEEYQIRINKWEIRGKIR